MKKSTKFQSSFGPNGKEQEYNHPDDLLGKAFEYFTWCDENPCMKTEYNRSGENKGKFTEIPLERPYTLSGLCVYCGISQKTFASYYKTEDMKSAAMHIADIICQHQTEGAVNGMYSQTLISRLLDQIKEFETTAEMNRPIVVSVVSQEGKDLLESIINGGKNEY